MVADQIPAENKVLIVQLGGLTPLIRQMQSTNVEVQCNAVGCITNLATHEENKAKIARSGALGPLTRLAKSKDMRVQRNATGALLNMTHSGAIPVLVQLLTSQDVDVQYYCTTALSNVAVDSNNRKKLSTNETRLVQSLVQLMDSPAPKVQCQAALALRNLASDEKYQLDIVKARGLPSLLRLLQSSYLPLILSAVACIRNISIHPQNESPIIDAGFLRPLVDLLGNTDNEEIQCHAISTLRNLAASSDRNKQLVLEAGAVQKCKQLVLSVPLTVQSEMTAAIAVLALSDDLKPHLLSLGVFDVLIPLTASDSIEVQGNSAAALGNLSSKVGDYSVFVQNWTAPHGGIHGYLKRFVLSGDSTFQHIAVWTLLQLLESGDKALLELIGKADDIVSVVQTIADRNLESDDEGSEDGENEVIGLSRRCLEHLAKGVLGRQYTSGVGVQAPGGMSYRLIALESQSSGEHTSCVRSIAPASEEDIGYGNAMMHLCTSTIPSTSRAHVDPVYNIQLRQKHFPNSPHPPSHATSMATIALPGDRLPSNPKTLPGPGTHTHHAALAASLAGPITTSASSVSIAHPTPRTSTTTNALPTVGATVLLRILRLTTRAATGAILTIAAPPEPAAPAPQALPCAEPFACTLRREDIRATEKDRVRVADAVRPGDIVRAEVISLGDQGGYYVSTARNELGVVLAGAEGGGALVPVSWCEMEDVETGVREARKGARRTTSALRMARSVRRVALRMAACVRRRDARAACCARLAAGWSCLGLAVLVFVALASRRGSCSAGAAYCDWLSFLVEADTISKDWQDKTRYMILQHAGLVQQRNTSRNWLLHKGASPQAFVCDFAADYAMADSRTKDNA
ncbi:hypothetical protein FH972_022776 [Carpinus fangiana]|uniref:Vacuolar protein 8 n=1 Tax=Carpinus fangiana TaxID=176857 RepID=A0A5N6KTW8_9ROSI|nr:hypothetical protein FH972_022776 [Carpinus fangiana]